MCLHHSNMLTAKCLCEANHQTGANLAHTNLAAVRHPGAVSDCSTRCRRFVDYWRQLLEVKRESLVRSEGQRFVFSRVQLSRLSTYRLVALSDSSIQWRAATHARLDSAVYVELIWVLITFTSTAVQLYLLFLSPRPR